MVFANTVLWKVRTRSESHPAIAVIRLFLIILLVGLGSAAAATTHYIASNGSDANNGTSKTTPWTHLPGMATCTSNCANYSPGSGDRFILRGCDTWGSSNLPVAWDWSSTTVTVDKTWYNTSACPSGWNRPIFDAQGNSGLSWFIQISANNSTDSVTFDNIEMVHFNNQWRMTGCYNSCTNPILTNLYIHAWEMTVDNGCVAFQLGAPPNTGGNFSNNVIDGSDRTGTSGANGVCYGIYHDWPAVIKNNVFRQLVNPLVGGVNDGGTVEIGGNLFDTCLSSAGGANHNNCLESFFGGTVYIHDNVVNMNNPNNAGETAFLGDAGEVDYVWNNIFYNITGNAPETEFRNGAVTQYWYNNTFVNTVGGSCLGATGSPSAGTAVIVKNNHCIGGGMPSSGGVYTASNNLTETISQATGNSSPHFDQYTSSETYVYSPLASTNSTIGAGANLTSGASWPSGYSTSDTSYGCTAKTVSGVVQSVCSGRTALDRPSSGAWDVGAYLFSGSAAQGPQPPTNLQAAVQ